MARKRGPLNVRNHLEHVRMVLDGLKEHGMCAILEEELNKVRLMNDAIIAQHDKKRADGDRHDIR